MRLVQQIGTMKKLQLTRWFYSHSDGQPKRAGFYEAEKQDGPMSGIGFLHWSGDRWVDQGHPNTDGIHIPVLVIRWRGVVPDADYPFEQVEPAPNVPELVNVRFVVNHSDWSEFSEDYGVAAPVKLILRELAEYVQRLEEYLQHRDDVPAKVVETLSEFATAIEQTNDDLKLEPKTVLDEPVDEWSRLSAETDYSENVLQFVDYLFETLNEAEADLEDAELEALHPATQAALRNLDIGLDIIKRLLEQLYEC